MSSCIISNHRKEYNPRIKHRLLLFDLRAEDVWQRKTVLSPKSRLKQDKKQQQQRQRQHGCSLVTFITTDFSMLLETSRCMPQNTEEKEMTKLRDARHAAQKQ